VDLKITVKCELEGADKSYELTFREPEITIGSDDTNMVPIPDPQVSDWHARIEGRGEDIYFVDLGSTSGSVVDGRRVEPTGEAKLSPSSEIRISSYLLALSPPDRKEMDDTTSEKTSMVAMDMVKAILGSLSSDEEKPPVLEVLNDNEQGAKLTLGEEREYTLGREKSCDLVLKHWSISRRHAMVRRSGSGTTLMDLKSKNGVLLNGDRVTEPARMKSGDVISVGHTEVRFSVPGTGLTTSGVSIPAISDAATPSPEKSAPRAAARTPAKKESAPPSREEPARERVPDGTPEPPRETAPPARHQPSAERTLERETSFADYIPIILGIILLLAAAGVAVYLFVLKK
jgi:pSer/pThr/pTyr-binding forkhead associated (FHA) protein